MLRRSAVREEASRPILGGSNRQRRIGLEFGDLPGCEKIGQLRQIAYRGASTLDKDEPADARP